MTDHKENKDISPGAGDKTGGKDQKRPAKTTAGGGLPRRVIYITLILLISLGILVWRQFFAPQMPTGSGQPVSVLEKPKIGGPFTLVDQTGKTVTEADFKGQYLLIYFGYTFCPDVCPTSLSTMANALDLIGDKAARVTPIFITVDPERDTPEQMKMYVKYFYPRLVGLTGSYNQIAEVAKAYKVYYAKAVDGSGEDYLMDHSSITYLMGPDGEFISHFSHGVDAEEMAKRLNEILK